MFQEIHYSHQPSFLFGILMVDCIYITIIIEFHKKTCCCFSCGMCLSINIPIYCTDASSIFAVVNLFGCFVAASIISSLSLSQKIACCFCWFLDCPLWDNLKSIGCLLLWRKEAFVYTLCLGFESLCSIECLSICFHYRKPKANHSIFNL